MMTLLFLSAKAKSIIGALFTFILANWQVFLIGLILSIGLFKYNAAVKRAVKAETALSSLHQEIALQTKAREIENAIKAVESKKAIASAEQTAVAQIKRFKLNRVKLTNDVKALYENRIDSINANWNERVRIEQGKANVGLPNEPSNIGLLARSESECNSAAHRIDVLEKAAIQTTIDFNLCRATVDADTLACGRAK